MVPREHFLDSVSLPTWRERQVQGNDVARAAYRDHGPDSRQTHTDWGSGHVMANTHVRAGGHTHESRWTHT